MKTVQNLAVLGAPVLLCAYNELAAVSVKRFSDVAAAVRRTSDLLKEKGWVLVQLTDGEQVPEEAIRLGTQRGDQPTTYLVPAAVLAPKKPAPKKPTSAPTTTARGPKPEVSEAAVITVLVDKNPKRAGSRAAARFALYRPGMTVGIYLTKAHDLEQGLEARHWYRADIRWDLAHGHISVKEPGSN